MNAADLPSLKNIVFLSEHSESSLLIKIQSEKENAVNL